MSFLQRQAMLDLDVATGWLMLAVELKNAGRIIGEVGIYIGDADPLQGNIGWSLHAEHQGKGFASEAAKVLLDFSFERRALHRVTANCDTRNLASVGLADRLRMRREGVFKESRLRNGQWHDEYAYGLLRGEWQGIKMTARM